uniref:Uncharacterized protein n=1 Tax=Arundo donax TaxID=35708 RepID=A0A0A9AQ80_ARUDO
MEILVSTCRSALGLCCSRLKLSDPLIRSSFPDPSDAFSTVAGSAALLPELAAAGPGRPPSAAMSSSSRGQEKSTPITMQSNL